MRMLAISRNGDDLIGEWTSLSSESELKPLRASFSKMRERGFRAFGMTSGRRVDDFGADLDEDIILFPPMVGG